MNLYRITYADHPQHPIEIRVDTFQEAFDVAKRVTDAEILKIEKVIR